MTKYEQLQPLSDKAFRRLVGVKKKTLDLLRNPNKKTEGERPYFKVLDILDQRERMNRKLRF